MRSVLSLINEVRQRPALYIGRHEIESFHAFLGGWLHGQEQIADPDLLEGFQDWVEKRFRVRNTQSWDRVILFYSQDSSHALDSFFELFDAYLKEREAQRGQAGST